jgi:hypothetical protein
MHLAFWDGLSLSKFEEWERTGEVQVPPMRDMVDGINQAMLPWWRTIAPAQVRHAVVAAAEAVDHKGETLIAPIVEAILVVRPRSLTRAIHRRQHLDQIERALAGSDAREASALPLAPHPCSLSPGKEGSVADVVGYAARSPSRCALTRGHSSWVMLK